MRLSFLALGVIAGFAPAQKTWIVDAFNGPGTHFTDLPPAVQAAAPGDHVVVRTSAPGGTYTAPMIARGSRSTPW